MDNPLNTVGTIARRLGVPIHRVLYIIEARHIEPVGMAGHARVFSAQSVQQIETELARTAGRVGDAQGVGRGH